jgi:type IX secretion system PorP/SprF family membrane protein
MLKRTFYTLLILLAGISAHAQQDAQFSQYMFNNIYLSPAFSGVDGVTQVMFMHRSQWAGYESSFGDGGAPTTQMLNFTTPIHKIKSGFGTYILNDQLGPLNNQEIQASYAYHLGIKESKLSFGIKVGMFAQSINYDMYRYLHPNDPLLENKTGKESQVRPDIGAGIVYRAEKYYVGFGINHLTRAKFDFGVNDVRNALENHMNFTAGYFYEVNFDLQVSPSVLVKTDFNEFTFDAGVVATFKDKMWGGITGRQGEALNVLLGYAFFKDHSLKLGYSIDVVVKDREAKSNFSHELMLSYQLPVNPGTGKKVVRTPRYRH